MPSLTLIQLKRSIGAGATAAPPSLAEGEPAFTSNDNILYIGGESSEIVPVGSKRFPGVLTANHALVASSTSFLDDIKTTVLNLGHATDTTLARDSAGVLSVEGVVIPSISSTSTLTGKTIDAGIFTGITDVQQSFEISGDISPAALAAQTDNWAPSGLATASAIRVLLTGNQSLTGLTGGADGRLMMIHNIDGVDTLTVVNESGASTAANRFAVGGNLTLAPNESVLFHYDSTTSRWRSLAGPSTTAGLGDHLTDLDALSAVSGADEIMVSTAAGTWAFESGDTAAISLGLGSTDSPQLTALNVGHASDTTLARSGAGQLTVEGVAIPTISSTHTLTAKTIDAGIFTGVTDVQESFELSGDISPTALAAETNNWAPTNLATSTTVRVTLTGNQNLTGLTGGADGRIIILHNVDTVDTLTLLDESASSTAANRFFLSGSTNLAVSPEQSVMLRYDATSSRWRDIAYTGGGGALGAHLTDLDALSAVSGADEIMVSTGAGVWAFESGDTARISLGIGSSDNPEIASINLGHASDTTLSRSAAGVLAVEGVVVVSNTSGIQDLVTVGAVGGDNEFLVGTAAGVLAWENAATARTSMGAGVGDVTASGSPLNGELAVWTSGTDIEGDALLTFGTSDLTVFGPAGTGAASAGVLSLSTNELTVVVATADQLGRIDFQAPLETGADAILVAASIWAEAGADFTATSNETDLVFALGVSEAAAEKARLTAQGDWTIAGSFTAGTSDLEFISLTGSAGEFDTALQSDTFLFNSELGSVVQAFDTNLEDLAALGVVGAADNIMVSTGAGVWAFESGTTMRTSLGLGTGDNVTFTDITASGDLTVSGTLTTLDVTNLVIEDPLIKLAKNNNTTDVVDIGLYGLYDDTGSQDVYTGLFRDASDDKWHLFKLLQVEPTTTVNLGGAGYAQDTLVAALESDNVTITGGTIDAGTF